MSTLPIRIYGDAILHKKAKRVTQVGADLLQLVEQMAETMRQASGLGLAAPQVGKSLRVLVARADDADDTPVHCLINPRIVEHEGEYTDSEGCLSFPTLRGVVQRPLRVTVKAMTPDEEEMFLEAEGFLARVLQHEIDHLNGVLFVDQAEPDSLGWMIPDENEEDGYRLKATTLEQVQQAFERMRQKGQQGDQL